MRAIMALLRWFSYLFHFTLSTVSIAVSGVAHISGGLTLHLGMLPWSEHILIRVLLFGGLAGLTIVLLAMRGILRFLLVLWSAGILMLVVRGYFVLGYRFASPQEFRFAVYMLAASLVALVGSLAMPSPRKRYKR